MSDATDLLIIGQPSLDINVDHDGTSVREVGGAVVYSGHAAAALGHRVTVVPKGSPEQLDMAALFAAQPSICVAAVTDRTSTSIENVYLSADKERRRSRAISRIAPYQAADLPDVEASVWHLAGLMTGDIPPGLIEMAHTVAKCAIDVQCLLRRADLETGDMAYQDWEEKLDYLPMVDFLKTDAAEAEVLTGLADRRAAAVQLHAWGAAEVMVTHNTEVLVYDGDTFYTEPLRPRNLSGRSGRGDTCFASYLGERLHDDVASALRIAAGLVSLKMERPGPFSGTRQDVEDYIREFPG